MAPASKLTYRVLFVHPFMYLRDAIGVGWVTIGPLEERDESKVYIKRHDTALEAEMYVRERGGTAEYDVMWRGL